MKGLISMKNTRLIFVAGMSGAGKSTTAQRISNQLNKNNVKHQWLHEEITNHPIRHEEFSYGDLHIEEDMDINCDIMVKKWEKLAETILASDSVYVMEGCLYQSIIRYFIDTPYPEEKITAFYDRVMNAIAPTNPVLIFLRPQDVRGALKNVFPIRGDWWRDLILNCEGDGYFKRHPFEGEESVYKMWEHYQALSDIQFACYNGWKIKIDTTSGDWISHLKAIMELIELPYIDETSSWIPESLDNYIGEYSITLRGQTHNIQIFHETGQLYCRAFWPYMKLIPKEKEVFEIASFPIEFHFKQLDKKMVIQVSGNYDWDIVGHTLIKVSK
jgi:hypothetical protein